MATDPRERLNLFLDRARQVVRRWVPPGLRWLAGLILIGFGILGFLPILGFWMIPLGIIVAGMDIGPLWRWLRSKGR